MSKNYSNLKLHVKKDFPLCHFFMVIILEKVVNFMVEEEIPLPQLPFKSRTKSNLE